MAQKYQNKTMSGIGIQKKNISKIYQRPTVGATIARSIFSPPQHGWIRCHKCGHPRN